MIERERENDVMVAFVHNGSVATCFMNSMLQMFAYDAQQEYRRVVEYNDSVGPYIHDNRSRIARYFLECTDKQWLMFFDNDMEFESDVVHRLLAAAEKHDVKILGGAYWNKYAGTNVYLSWLLFTPEGIRALDNLPEMVDPVEVTAVGMGITLIHRTVLQDVADMHPNDPWDTFAADILIRFEDGGFATVRYPEEADEVVKDRPIRSVDRMGEDVTLCLRARRAGYLTYGLPTVTAEHFKPLLVPHGTGLGLPTPVHGRQTEEETTPEPDQRYVLQED